MKLGFLIINHLWFSYQFLFKIYFHISVCVKFNCHSFATVYKVLPVYANLSCLLNMHPDCWYNYYDNMTPVLILWLWYDNSTLLPRRAMSPGLPTTWQAHQSQSLLRILKCSMFTDSVLETWPLPLFTMCPAVLKADLVEHNRSLVGTSMWMY